MKCAGCKWQTIGVGDEGEQIKYCIGAPDDEPRNGAEKLIDKERILYFPEGTIYRADDTDECHLWHSERFKPGAK